MVSKSENLARAVKHIIQLHNTESTSPEKRYRKSSVGDLQLPYGIHPVEVMKRLFNWGIGDLPMLYAALGHDLKEDCGFDDLTLEICFLSDYLSEGDYVTAIKYINELTFTGDTKTEKQYYIDSFANRSIESHLIKIADRICNVWDFVHNGDIEYGYGYMKKAHRLISGLGDRANEISDKFGPKKTKIILHNINLDCSDLENILN